MKLLDRASTTAFSRRNCISLEVILDDDFDGIMYGLPEDSPGCRLKGKVVLKNSRALSVRYLVFMFLGKISVACGPAMSATRPDYSETQTIYRKQCVFHSSETSGKKISTGIHEYCFDFDLPGHLPSSFKRVRGKIEYTCYAILARPMFHSDITVKKIVILNRCLTNSISPLQQLNSIGDIFDDKVGYQINTPVAAYREGGLVTAEIKLKTSDPHIVVESIEYGLKEEINYRTTGEHLMSLVASIDENIFPLGKKKIMLNRPLINTSESIKISFRLCPWVNCDVDSELIYIEHKIVFTVVVIENAHTEADSSFDDTEFDDDYLDALSSDLNQTEQLVLVLYYHPCDATVRFSFSNNVLRRDASGASGNIKKKTKSYDLEIPLIVTTKSASRRERSENQSQELLQEIASTHSYHSIDEPPTYAMATMTPSPPAYPDDEEVDEE
ncbi:6534_t:CDS:2 [Acaulospora morrowiae]|uniref:6534_t:CDS:1 n=1 Tax=Acaulospora morrowiae TaxID=94023 RepID=A0A9N9D5U9_9GLOM|nr:6534_t:CDS:2 [Acaulospora morrowiae]